jgi:DNA-binding transcriptional regulator YbjK
MTNTRAETSDDTTPNEAALWQKLYEQERAKNNNTTLRQLEEMVQRQRLAQEEEKAERKAAEALDLEIRAFVAEVKLGRVSWPT